MTMVIASWIASDLPASEMTRMAKLISEKGWSVRDAERWAKKQHRPSPAPRTQDPNETAAADKLRLLLGTKVEIQTGPNGAGQIRIYFFNQEDLVRIYGTLTEKRTHPRL